MKTVKELETMLEEVRKDLEELKKSKNSFEPTPKGWKPKNGEKYWVAHYNLNPTVLICDERTITNNIIKYNRIFKNVNYIVMFKEHLWTLLGSMF